MNKTPTDLPVLHIHDWEYSFQHHKPQRKCKSCPCVEKVPKTPPERPKINDVVVYHDQYGVGRDLYGVVISPSTGSPRRYIRIEWSGASSGFLMPGDSDSVPVKDVEKLSTIEMVLLRMEGKIE